MQDMWNQRFSAEEYYYGTDPNPYFKERIDDLQPGKLLLPAEGEGRNGVYAALKGWQVTAADFSSEGRKKALKLAEQNQVSMDYLLTDITKSDFGTEQYDAVALIYAHMAPDIRRTVHRKLIRSLKPGGYLILEAFNRKQLGNSSGGPKSVDMLYSIEILEEDFNEMEIVELSEYEMHLDAGDGHSGNAEIIRFFGRK
jgi:SAM-dependent methyltransferase